MKLDLTPEEEEALRPSLRGTAAQGVAELASRWIRALEDIEEGYKLTIYDYQNDLDKRLILERAALEAKGKLQHKVRRFLELTDARLKKATFTAPNPVFPGAYRQHPEAWWYTRVPKKLIGELKGDIEEEGILANSSSI
jgi:hypothetical protein